MKQNVTLTITALLLILLSTIHITQDIMRDENGMASYVYVITPFLVIFLYGTLVLAGRRSGYVIIFLGSVLAAAMPVIHTMGAGNLKAREHGEFFVFTLLALGALGVFSAILAARELWSGWKR
jgi:hypothetical protein